MDEMKTKSLTDAYTQVYVEKTEEEKPQYTSMYLENLTHCVEEAPTMNEGGYSSIKNVYEKMLIEGLEEEYVSTHKTLEEAYTRTLNVVDKAKEQRTFMDWHIGEEDFEHRSQKK